MSRFRPSGLAVVATIFVVTGLGLMLASLRVESTRAPSSATAADDVLIPTTAPVAANATATPAPGEPKAERLFARAQAASRTLSYGGVKEVSRWVGGSSTTTLVRIDHVAGHGTVVRTNDSRDPQVTKSAVTVESDASSERAALSALVANYRLVSGPTTVVLDREVQVVEAFRADGSTAARFWIDEETGLVLRRELLDAQSQTLEAASYVNVDLKPAATAVPVPTPADAWSVLDATAVAKLRGDAWAIPEVIGGSLRLYQVRSQEDGVNRTVQLSYTDGLFGVSVFLQRGALDRKAMAGYVPVTVNGGEVWARSGSMLYTWQSKPGASDPEASDLVVSATADSPSAPVAAAFAAFPPLPAEESGVGAHVTRGVQRVGSWFDPLG